MAIVQIPLHTVSSAEAYVANNEWRHVRLDRCPLHQSGECSFVRHGSYTRVVPMATRIARWYCPEGHRTFSLLPDFFAARLPGLLSSIEEAVVTAETSTAMEVAADELRRDDVTLPSAVRWLRRRVRQVHDGMEVLCGLAAQELTAASPRLSALRQLGDNHPLLRLRSALPTEVLALVCVPLGLRPHRAVARERAHGDQHEVGHDAVSGCPYGADIADAVLPCDASPTNKPKPRPCRRRPRSLGCGAPIGV
jgi:hypothetical protein